MKISKGPKILKKAATAFKSKTDALRTKLLVLASLRRRMATVAAASRRIHALVVSSDGGGREKQARVEYDFGKALVLRKAMAAVTKPALDHSGMVVDLAEVVAMFDEEGYPEWTRSLFDDDDCHVVEDVEDHDDCYVVEDVDDDDDDCVLDDALDQPSVIEIIRSNREVEGLEFNMDEDIDEACDMFIRRFHNRMNGTF